MTHKSMSTEAMDLLHSIASRRSLIKSAAATAIAGGVFAACTDAQARQALMRRQAAGGAPTSPHPAQVRVAVTAAAAAGERGRMHEAGIKAFPAKTEGKGNRLLNPGTEKGLRIYGVTAEKIQWEARPG